jgi:small-conductance mechanosensitive channel/CRP-like cAMP-binding protein
LCCIPARIRVFFSILFFLIRETTLMTRSFGRVGYLLTPAALFAFFLLLVSRGDALPSFISLTYELDGRSFSWYLIRTGAWLLGGWLLIRLLNVFFWDGIVARTIGTSVPGLIKSLSAFVIGSLAITGVVGVVFQLSIAGFFATSGVVGLVVGFALRNIINDVFTGVALNVDRAFKIGEWVTVHAGERDIVGQVSGINWRTTQITTEDNTMVVLPNGALGQMIITNHWGHGREVRFEATFSLDPSVSPDRARRVFLSAVRAVAGLSGILEKPEAQVLVSGTSDSGVDYCVRYWMRPWEASSPSAARDVVLRSILGHLRQAGIEIAYPREDVVLTRSATRTLDSGAVGDRDELLSRIPLFRNLSPEELRFLAGRMRQRQIAHGTVLFHQGEQGASMFVVVEGLLVSTVLAGQGSTGHRAAQFVPGDFLGEFSLITGAEREATVTATTDSVVFEITKADVDALCDKRPELVQILATSLVDRMLDISHVVEQANTPGPSARSTGGSWNMLRRMLNGMLRHRGSPRNGD